MILLLLFWWAGIRKKKVKKDKLRGLESSFDLLKKLEVALRTNRAGWTEEFCDHPNMGHVLIMDYMDALPSFLESKNHIALLNKEEVCVQGLTW